MVDPKVIEAVTYFKACIQEKGVRIHDLIIFGSSGSGNRTQWSDIDIAVISEDFKDKDIFARTLLTKDAELMTIRKYRVPLDIITLTPEEYNSPDSLFLRNIRKGIPLVSAQSA
ncbi:MAG: nucleotidyltransferase domain-containing protein [Methanoregula sp.]|nr:nucleotidyltransferase domain-containing protein [Methanoregula sp.]